MPHFVKQPLYVVSGMTFYRYAQVMVTLTQENCNGIMRRVGNVTTCAQLGYRRLAWGDSE